MRCKYMEVNYIWNYGKTCWYIDFENKRYGVRINKNDARKANQIINQARKNHRDTIATLKQDWKISA